MTNLLINIIGNPNLKVSKTNLCLHIVGKLGMMKVRKNRINKTPKEKLTTSPAIIAEKKFNIR